MSVITEDTTTINYTLPGGVKYRREIVRIPRNETASAKSYRLIVALVRDFAREYPDEAARIVREESGD